MNNSFQKLSKLGSGKTADVYLCRNNSGEKFAIKEYKSDINMNIHEQEVQILSDLEHPNIIQMFQKTSDSVVFEYASNGDIFDYALTKPFESELARYYMIQLINVLDYIHQQNICHRDLKLENLFLDADFQLKVGDFGLAQYLNLGSSLSLRSSSGSQEEMSLNSTSTDYSELNSSTESNWLYECVGTENYMAPELINKQKYLGEQVDIFAIGVVLFSLTHGFPPYQKIAHVSDPFYKLLIEKKYAKYWQILEKKTKIKNDSNFMDLINKLLESDPTKRITLDEIKAHPWMHGDIYTQEQIVQAMTKRQQAAQKC